MFLKIRCRMPFFIDSCGETYSYNFKYNDVQTGKLTNKGTIRKFSVSLEIRKREFGILHAYMCNVSETK